MSARQDAPAPEGRLYVWIAAPLAVALLGSGALLMVAMLATVIGPFSLSATPQVSASERIAIWYPPSAAAPEWLRAKHLQLWQSVFPAPVELVGSAALAELLERNPSLLIVAATERMNRAEVESLRGYVRQGGAALTAGWIGAGADLKGELDTSIMRELLEVKQVARLSREQSYFAAAGARGPLLAGIPPGERFEIPAQDAVPALADESAELFWSSWAIAPYDPAAGASRRLQIGKGRLAWLAMPPILGAPAALDESSGASDAPAHASIARVFRNAADWARARPSGELLAWPKGAPYAGLLAMDTEDRFETAQGVAERARKHGFPVTFLVLGQLASQHPALLGELAAVGEVGSHADVHDGFAGQALDVQRQRLEAAMRQLRGLGVASPRGFRPPLESYDAATPRALLDAGFDYLLGDRELRRQVPALLVPEGGRGDLVQIPRTGADDIDLLVKRQIQDPAEIGQILLGDLTRIARGGGLYYFSFHTQYFGDAQRLDLLDRIMSELRRGGAWCATGSEIADWWRLREQIAVHVRSAGPRRVQVEVTNRGERPVSGAVVRVYANVRLRSADAAAAALFRAAPSVVLEPGAQHADLVLPALSAGASATYFLDFAPAL